MRAPFLFLYSYSLILSRFCNCTCDFYSERAGVGRHPTASSRACEGGGDGTIRGDGELRNVATDTGWCPFAEGASQRCHVPARLVGDKREPVPRMVKG
jgi:hypothetical protein